MNCFWGKCFWVLFLTLVLALIPLSGYSGRLNIRAVQAPQAPEKKEMIPDHPSKALVNLPFFSWVPEKPEPPPIPDALVAFGKEDGSGYALVVEKKSQTLHVYKAGDKTEEIFSLACSTGEKEGPKQKSGDRKTPEGVYFFLKHHPKEELTPIYGTHAFPTDYPNAWDRIQNKGGYAIWLHGTDKPLKPMDSNGCVALSNPDIDRLVPYIRLNHTPLVIYHQISYAAPKELEQKKGKIEAFVQNWISALNKGTYHEYLVLYSPDYFPDMSWWNQWSLRRKDFDSAGRPDRVATSDLQVLYHEGVYVALFDSYFSWNHDKKRLPIGRKKLFIKNSDPAPVIVAESYQGENFQDGHGEEAKKKHPLLAAWATLPEPLPEKDSVIRFVDNWLAAWSSGDMEAYGRFYADEFRSGGKTKTEWIAKKRRISESHKDIQVVRKQGPAIESEDPFIRVSFVQEYTSSHYSVMGRKFLVLKRQDNQLKIMRETWEKL